MLWGHSGDKGEERTKALNQQGSVLYFDANKYNLCYNYAHNTGICLSDCHGNHIHEYKQQ